MKTEFTYYDENKELKKADIIITLEYNGKKLSVWSKDSYLELFKEWQSIIPERCWIEDYYRKYFRPYELYNDTMFISMMEGGQKKHQRKQYETYQNTYMFLNDLQILH